MVLTETGLAKVFQRIKSFIASQLNSKANLTHTHNASDITSGLATVATSGSYNDLSNKPTIPTVNNATLTIQKNGTTVKTFTANASSNVTANITVPTKTSDLTNDSGFITSDNTKIPLAGSNAISGSLIPATDNAYNLGNSTNGFASFFINKIRITGTEIARKDATSILVVRGGTTHSDGAYIVLSGSSSTSDKGTWKIHAVIDKSTRSTLTGEPKGTLTWSGQPIQYGSDQRLKQQIAEIDDKLLDAWEDVNLVQFKYNDAVDQKGKDKARLHTGYVVQQIDKACKSHNVDISAYGLYCHEEYPEETEEVEVEQKDGTKVKETKVIREASEHYSLRYTETLVVECAYLRKRIKELEERLEKLEGNSK